MRVFRASVGLFSCLAIFTKDVSGLASLVIIFIYLVLCWRWKELFHPLFLLGLLVATGPVLGWIWLDRNTLFHGWWHWNFLHLLKSPGFNLPWYYYIPGSNEQIFLFLAFCVLRWIHSG